MLQSGMQLSADSSARTDDEMQQFNNELRYAILEASSHILMVSWKGWVWGEGWGVARGQARSWGQGMGAIKKKVKVVSKVVS